MKITKNRLKRIIKEELANIVSEGDSYQALQREDPALNTIGAQIQDLSASGEVDEEKLAMYLIDLGQSMLAELAPPSQSSAPPHPYDDPSTTYGGMHGGQHGPDASKIAASRR